MIRAVIAALFPRTEYVLGLGFIAALPGGLSPSRKVLQQQPGHGKPELTRGIAEIGSIIDGHEGATGK